MPIWGRLSDLHGRREMYLIGVAVFLVGSAASGAATSMPLLIAARALQGLGAGAVIPLGMTVVGELYTITERARVQALFSGVWGLASIAGPLAGGYITDALSWRWVFYLNLPFGLLAAAVIALAYPASPRATTGTVDWMGALFLFGGTSALLVAVGGDIGAAAWWWAAAALVLLAAFVRLERRSPDPMLPIDLLRTPIVARTLVVVFLVGMALFGAITFIPLFVQSVRGGTATEAGQVLTPLFLGWVAMSVATARLTVRLGYRGIAITGSAVMLAGFVALQSVQAGSPRWTMLGAGLLIGAGMGMSMLSMLLAIQHGVPRAHLGLATSLQQFSRSVGAAIGVAGMGALLTRGLAGLALPGGNDGLAAGGALTGPARLQFADALHQVFVAGGVLAGASLLASFFLPALDFSSGVAAGEQAIAPDLAALEAERKG